MRLPGGTLKEKGRTPGPIGAGTPLFACGGKRRGDAGRRNAGKRGAPPSDALERAFLRFTPEGKALWGMLGIFWTAMKIRREVHRYSGSLPGLGLEDGLAEDD